MSRKRLFVKSPQDPPARFDKCLLVSTEYTDLRSIPVLVA